MKTLKRDLEFVAFNKFKRPVTKYVTEKYDIPLKPKDSYFKIVENGVEFKFFIMTKSIRPTKDVAKEVDNNSRTFMIDFEKGYSLHEIQIADEKYIALKTNNLTLLKPVDNNTASLLELKSDNRVINPNWIITDSLFNKINETIVYYSFKSFM